MKLTLTFTNRKKSVDFLLNDELVMKDALEILAKNTDFMVSESSCYIYSKRKEEMISTAYTFRQAEIYSGDELLVEG